MADDDDAHRLQTAIATILRVQKIMEPSLQTTHGELKLAPADIQTMRYVAEHPGTMASRIAGFLGVVPTTMSSIVDRLVNRGFLQRSPIEGNRRAIALDLTEVGIETFRQIDSEELGSSRLMLGFLPPSDQAAFVASMERIANALGEIERGDGAGSAANTVPVENG